MNCSIEEKGSAVRRLSLSAFKKGLGVCQFSAFTIKLLFESGGMHVGTGHLAWVTE